MSSLESPRPRVLKGENDSSFRVSNIRSDTDPSSSLAIAVTDSGDVGISILDPEKGIVSIDLYPLRGGGANPQITAKFREFARDLANLIDTGGE